ncbi:hypothetical protein IFU08_08090 [Microbacterium sp. CFBP 8790]|uniref:hypothetical protein n=1 Tax=unclassified Microbacterium TaxID=2609290 RepID=UPI001786A8EE|nr:MULTISPECIES: hypothetical protein [unclassified Microbacterium]MBD8205956.1 hypothetical protein [Microbacterium sp. CFBP 8801]MBD8509530.1 hypothetical protein [Microbacterium sp. CFBP 8790]
MERSEKARVRAYIGQHLDVSGTRLSDYQAQCLVDFIDTYDRYRGKSFKKEASSPGFGSDGRYVRVETIVDTFIDPIGIRRETHHSYDDGHERRFVEDITSARGIFDWLFEHR